MAMKEIEAMYDAIDELNERSVQQTGQSHKYYEALQQRVEDASVELTDAFAESVESGRKLSAAVRNFVSHKITQEEYTKQEHIALNATRKAEYHMDKALETLNDYADSLNVPKPQGRHKNGRSFARELVGEYEAYSHAYSRAIEKSVKHGIPFTISEHAPRSEKLMQIGNESVQRIREAMQAKEIDQDYLSDIPKFEHIGSREFLVRNSLGNISQDLDKQDVRAVVNISRHDNGKHDTVIIPATYIPGKNVYIIREADYEAKIASQGAPFAAIDIEVPAKPYDPDDPGKKDRSILARSESVMKQHGYTGNIQSDTYRQNLIKTLLDNKVLTRAEMSQYFDFRNNMAKNNPRFDSQRENLLKDAEFVEGYEPKFERSKGVKDAEIIAK